jgi:hypothetical protein
MKRTKNLGAVITAVALLFAACETPINNNNNNNEDQKQEQEQEQEQEQLQEYTITVNSNVTGGHIIPVPEKAKEGDTVTLVAAPAVYYTLAGSPLVSTDNSVVELSGNGHSEPYSFIMPAANVTVLPSFVINTSHNIWPINTSDDLALIGNDEDYPLNGVYQLQNNITLPEDWAPIGNGTKVFSGIFDGNGKIITANSFLYEDDDGPLEYPGIFGFTVAATIKNLTLNLNQVKAQPQSANFGFLAAYSLYSELQDIALTGDFEINLDNTIKSSAGAIAGVLDHSQLQRARLQGNLTVSRGNAGTPPGSTFYNNIGGLAGFVTLSSIRECTVTGDVTIASLFMNAGGIAGNVVQSAMTVNSMAGNLSIISINDYKDYVSADEIADIHIGGLAGGFVTGSITDSAFDGNIVADLSGSATGGTGAAAQVGGIIGNFSGEARASSLSFNGHIEFKIAGDMMSRSCSIGGVSGYSSSAQIQNSSFKGAINVVDGLLNLAQKNHFLSTGGIIGQGNDSTTKECSASGVITATNEDTLGSPIGTIFRTYTGGIAGNFSGGINEINSCYFTGSITSNGKYPNAGGILGLAVYNTLENKIIQCFASLEKVLVKGSEKIPSPTPGSNANGSLRITAGGIVGRYMTTSGINTVEYCVALYDGSGAIKAEGNENQDNAEILYAGSIVGNRYNTAGTVLGGTLTANITNIPTSAIEPHIPDPGPEEDTNAGKNGEYVANITQESFFARTEDGGLGWDNSVWAWDSVKGLPKLAWQ